MSSDDVNAYRWTLFHVTSVEHADSIIKSQCFHTGDGLYGVGVYFANTIGACKLKIMHHLKKDPNYLKRLTYLVADVYVGKAKPYSKKQAIANKPDAKALLKRGYTSVIGYELPTGREVICLDPSRIHNIKYALGQRPPSFFPIDRKRIVLFFVSSKQMAREAHDNQGFPKTNGKYGKGIYLYMSLGDALDDHPKSETYMACEANLNDFCKLRPGETLKTNKIKEKGYKSFITPPGHGTQCFIFKDPSLIFNIHFCGGQPWKLSHQ